MQLQLDGDVAAKAQELADDKMLSKTLSTLLRNHFGMTTEIEAAKNRLNELVNQRMMIREEEYQLAEWIDEAENQLLRRSATEKPRLESKLKEIQDLHLETMQKLRYAPNPYEKNRIEKVLNNQKEIIDKLQKQLEVFE